MTLEKQKILKWKPKTFNEMVKEMVNKDLQKAQLEENIKSFKSNYNAKN